MNYYVNNKKRRRKRKGSTEGFGTEKKENIGKDRDYVREIEKNEKIRKWSPRGWVKGWRKRWIM